MTDATSYLLLPPSLPLLLFFYSCLPYGHRLPSPNGLMISIMTCFSSHLLFGYGIIILYIMLMSLQVVQDFVQSTEGEESPQRWLHRIMSTSSRETEEHNINLLGKRGSINQPKFIFLFLKVCLNQLIVTHCSCQLQGNPCYRICRRLVGVSCCQVTTSRRKSRT